MDARSKNVQKNQNEIKGTLSQNNFNLNGMKTAYDEIEKLFDEILEILNLFFEYKMPCLIDSASIENFSFNFSLYILFILKYPSHLRGQRIEKMGDILKIGKSIDFQNYPLHIFCKNETLGFHGLLEKNAIFSSLANEFASIQILLSIDFYDLLIIDPMHFLENFLALDGKTIIIEEFTMNINTEKNVTLAIEKGFVLLIKDYDEGLKELINQISMRKKEKMLRYHIERYLKQENEQEKNDAEIEIREEICIFNKKMQIHPKFRLILVLHDEKTIISNEISSQFLIISLDIQEKTIWQESSANLFINKFYLNEKLEALTVKEYAFENFFDKNEEIFIEIMQDIRKVTLDDISLIPKISSQWNIVRQKFNENIQEIQNRSEFFKNGNSMNEVDIYRKYLRERIMMSNEVESTTFYSYSLFQSK